ncbi:MAG: hypothetical protein ACTH8F_07485 [Microbacterium sp.]|uniref:hypothetical protein n=1 Tax=Microbacterium sp. TaxID=51671 RepID=UPI003F9932DD
MSTHDQFVGLPKENKSMMNLRKLTGLTKGQYALFAVAAPLTLLGFVVSMVVIIGPSAFVDFFVRVLMIFDASTPPGWSSSNGGMSTVPPWIAWPGLASLLIGGLLLYILFRSMETAEATDDGQ